MSQKLLIISGIVVILLVNGSIFGTLYLVDIMNGPTPEELKAIREAEEAAALDAVYAKLPPMPEFKSKAKNIRSIGEAISICESKLNTVVTEKKSWEVNMIESRYMASSEVYKIFLVYQTLATVSQGSKVFKVTCEVSGVTRVIDVWKAHPV